MLKKEEKKIAPQLNVLLTDVFVSNKEQKANNKTKQSPREKTLLSTTHYQLQYKPLKKGSEEEKRVTHTALGGNADRPRLSRHRQ